MRRGRVVATAIGRRRAVLTRFAGAAAAIGFLVVMALSGRARESGQFVRFAPAGVLTSAPVEIDRVELSTCARGWPCVAVEMPWVEALGVNSQAQLAAAEAVLQDRLRQTAMARGVTLIGPKYASVVT